jgi:hypothetical protein
MNDEIQMNDDAPVTLALEHSPQVGELTAALAKAQAEMQNPDFDSTNFYHTGYASLAAVRNATIPPLARAGIATTQHAETGEGWARCITVLWYGEQYIKSTVSCRVVKTVQGKTTPVDALTHQDYKAVFSYLRRTGLEAVCGVAGEKDDDGEEGWSRPRQGSAPKTTSQGAPSSAGRDRQSSSQAITSAVQQREAERQRLLREIHDLYNSAIVPLKHSGMYKAIFFHCFHLDKPELIKEQLLETLEAGMALYRHLTAQLGTWDRTTKPDDWIGEHQRRLATEASAEEAVPDGVNPETGEDLSDMPAGWLTKEEQRAQQARGEAALLEETTA